MTTFLDNQIDLFDLDSAVPEPADCTGKEQLITKPRSADRPKTTVRKGKSPDKTVSNSELMTLVERHQKRIWTNDKTRQNTVSRIQRFDSFGDNSKLKLDEIGALHIYDWLDYEKERGLSDASVNRYASAMSAVLSFAVELKLRSDSPKLRYTKEFSRDRYMTDEEIDQLIAFFIKSDNQWMADMVFVGANTGMRLGEILHLSTYNNGQHSTNSEAKVRQDCIYLPAEITKTRDGRLVSINSAVRKAALRLVTSIGKHFTHRKFYDRWDDARAKIAPNDKDFVFHCLRHTCASRMANDLQINSLLIAKQLGHKTLTTTDKYVHAKPEASKAFTDAMSVGVNTLEGAVA